MGQSVTTTPRLDNSFDGRPVHRIKFYIFAVVNNQGHPFRWFTLRESADKFITDNPGDCGPESVLIEVE